jgi:hypothetical protein
MNLYILFVFRMILTINSDHFPKQHQPVDLCNGHAEWFLSKTEFLIII